MNLASTDKRALLLSASRGFGFQSARTYAAEGAHVILTGRSADCASYVTSSLVRVEGGLIRSV